MGLELSNVFVRLLKTTILPFHGHLTDCFPLPLQVLQLLLENDTVISCLVVLLEGLGGEGWGGREKRRERSRKGKGVVVGGGGGGGVGRRKREGRGKK